jgi:hypothetical protein
MALNENKSGDSSLRDWFGKSKSSDGTPGWVQLGGKYAGKPCAKQPGQTTKPKCGSSKMKRALSKDEEEAAFRRKQKQDPNPDRKGKAINVKTEGVSTDVEVPSKNLKALAARAVKRIDADVDGDVDTSDPKTQEMGEFIPSPDGKKKIKTKVQRESTKLLSPKELLGEKCWKGYTAKGLKKKGNRMVPNCVPVGEEAIEERSLTTGEEKDKEKYVKGMKKSVKDFKSRYGDDYKSVMYATATKMAKEEVVDEAAAWTRKAGKNKSGGLNEKGRKSYEAENPGSDLKRPSKKVGNPRRKSFCARMKGMKKKLTSSKTANDPDSRINKSLRAWNC